MGEQRVWKFENPGKVKMITRCVSTCLGFVQLCLAIYAMAVFTKSQGNVADTISTWELVRPCALAPLALACALVADVQLVLLLLVVVVWLCV